MFTYFAIHVDVDIFPLLGLFLIPSLFLYDCYLLFIFSAAASGTFPQLFHMYICIYSLLLPKVHVYLRLLLYKYVNTYFHCYAVALLFIICVFTLLFVWYISVATGIFEPDHMQFELDRHKDAAGEPSLADMTEKAIKLLQRNDKGYFLMVEGEYLVFLFLCKTPSICNCFYV